LLFVAYASGNSAAYAETMQEAMRPLGVSVAVAPPGRDVLGELAAADALFVGGGNTFRLLRALHALELIELIRERVRKGLPYLGASAGSDVACPAPTSARCCRRPRRRVTLL